ncbi:sugar phosphate isomerase/epimerase family protein [Paenarthrobacter sp. NPDC057981]|uniref:sugar phosphate isomerase/epimerase family protein n=1 Tax=Paenarthrobacter sp. NPDC057981 TaxID=3346297 RepID=UPI0036DCD3FF
MAIGQRLIGLASLTMIPVHPVDFVEVAGEAGFDFVNLRLAAPHPRLPYPLMGNKAELEKVQRTLDQFSVQVLDVEVIRVDDHLDISSLHELFSVAKTLGAQYVIAMNLLADEALAIQRFGAVAAVARQYGLMVMVEPFIFSETRSLAAAERLAQASGGSVLIDTLHFVRMGEDLSALPERIVQTAPYVQISDGLMRSDIDLSREAFTKRLAPGQGHFPLAAFLRTLPSNTPISFEVPDNDRLHDIGPRRYAKELFTAVTRFLETND